MTDNALHIFNEPVLNAPSLVMGMNGWMDGGDVSTGTIEYLRIKLGAVPFAEVAADGFYVMNIPGSVESTTLFRPRVEYRDGLIKQYEYPANQFFVQADYNLILFSGKEPNLCWDGYADAILSLCRRFDVRRILFVGSVAGLAPHSRDPRVLYTLSRQEAQTLIERMGFHASSYEGPSSFVTHLSCRAADRQLDVVGLIAEIPVYLQGYNPKCIETMVRCVSSILGMHLVCDDLRMLGEEYEKRVSEMVSQQPELAERVEQLEESHDNEIFDTELEDLKTWLHSRGIRVD